MDSQINLSNKKKIFTISSILKSGNGKKNFSSRSNTQEMPQYNNSKNKSSSCKYRKNKNNNNSLYNNKNENYPKKFTGMTNISTKINSDTNSKTKTAKNDNKSLNICQYKELINIKDKKIDELEKLIKIYREKLKNQIRVFNINTSINSFNLSKTRSSTNITERNMNKIRSLSNSQAKIKATCPLKKNIYGSKIVNNKMNYNNNKSKKRPKTNNYRKPKMNNYFFGKKNIDNKIHINNFKRNETNSKQKYINKSNDNNSKYKRAKSSNIEKNRKNNNLAKSCTNNKNTNNVNKDENLLTIEETKILCDNLMEKMKNVLELVKMATTND